MFTKTILAVATAAVLSAGAVAASTSAADAHYSNGYYQTYCKTFYETVLVGYDYYNQPIYKSVPYQKCEKIFVPTYNDNYNHYNSYSNGYHYGY
jgi:hypothetical protein